jgi:uncharacterized protein YggE
MNCINEICCRIRRNSDIALRALGILTNSATKRSTALAAFIVMIASRAALAEEGIVVHSTGSASARPTCVEMSARLSAEAELAADASVKFRDAKKRAMAAMTALKNAKLSVKPGGVTVATGMDSRSQQMMMMRGFATDGGGGQKVRITETSRIVLADADKLESEELLGSLLKILDSAKDAGFSFTMPVTNDYYEMQARAQEGQIVFQFKLPDTTSLRKKAFKAALDDARARAQELAELSSIKLGRILSVQEGPGGNQQGVVYYYRPNMGAGEDNALSSAAAGEVTMHVNLTVQFEIVK